MSFGLFRMCVRGDCVIDMTNKRLIKNLAPGGNVNSLYFVAYALLCSHYGTPSWTSSLGPDLQNILRLSYDNAKVMIDLPQTSNLQNVLQRTQGF